MKEIRLLKASEIECRVQSCGKSQNGGGWCSLLLYKDARVDQRLLDELFGPLGWQRRHESVNGQVCCIVSVFDKDTKTWIEKEDVGTESNTEAIKGQFSDSFKRACFNLGIGRELYTAPTIFVNLADNELQNGANGKVQVNRKVVFTVAEIGYDEERNINALVIVDQTGRERYKLGQKAPQQQQANSEAPQQQANSDTEDQLNGYALPSIRQARTRKELTRIWNDFPQLQDDQRFITALNNRQNEINQAA